MALTKKQVKKIAYYLNRLSEDYYFDLNSKQTDLMLSMEDVSLFLDSVNKFITSYSDRYSPDQPD